jgi:large subunit ribosomal protein L29
MANSKYEQIAGMSTPELEELLDETRVILQKMQFNHAVSPIEDSTQLGETRRKIARISTELRKRQLEESK